MNDNTAKAVRELIKYEYQVYETPKFVVMDEKWELVDIFPSRSIVGNYVLVFRKKI